MTDPGFEAAAWSWAEHLRAGGTTTWREWRTQQHPAVAARWPTIPSAAQLEVVRRLALLQRDGDRSSAGRLADLVAGTPVGGRGLVDAPLPWPGPRRGIGAPAIEPDEMPAGELLRACVAAIVRTGLSGSLGPDRPVRVRRRPWRRAFVVAGVSPHAEAVRSALLEAGHAEGGRRPTVLVVGAPLDAMMSMHWRRRVERGSGARWRRVWSRAAARGALPGPMDLSAVGDSWAARVGADKVHVVLGHDPGEAVAVAAGVLDLRLDVAVGAPGDVVQTDLLRRINQVLAIRGPAAVRSFRSSVFGQYLARPAAGRPLGVPNAQLGWAVEQAEGIAERLGAGAYGVHGDTRVVVPLSDASLRRSVDPRDTLSLALGALAGCERLAVATARPNRVTGTGGH